MAPTAESKSPRGLGVGSTASPSLNGGDAGIFDIVLPANGTPPFILLMPNCVPSSVGRPATGTPGSAAQRILDARGSWYELMSRMSLSECVEVMGHFLRSLKQPLLTSELARWFHDVDPITETRHQLRLLTSLVHCLPRPNRACLRMILSALPRDASSLPVLAPLGSAMLGAAPSSGTVMQGVLAAMLTDEATDLIFLNRSPLFKTVVTEDVLGTPYSDRMGVVASCTPAGALDLLCDPYYTAIIESDYVDLLPRMHTYVFVSEPDCLVAVNMHLRRFLGTASWQLDARLRLLVFVKNLVPHVLPTVLSSPAWTQRWTELCTLVTYDVSRMMPQTCNPMLRGTAHWILTFNAAATVAAAAGTATAASTSSPSIGGGGPLLEQSPELVALSLQRLFVKQFAGLNWIHLVQQRWQEAATSPPFAELVRSFNSLQQFCVNWILEPEQPKERAAHLSFVVKVANCCRKQNNFHAAFALFFVCTDPAIARLARTWKLVSSKVQGHLAKLKALSESKNNHSAYTSALRDAVSNPPVIPYMALVSKYLFTFEEANPNYLDGNKETRNFVKFRMIHTYLSSVLDLRVSVMSLNLGEESIPISQLVARMCAAVHDPQAMYARSLVVEPRE